MPLNEFFTQCITLRYGENIAAKILEGMGQKRCATLRINTLKAEQKEVCQALEEAGISYRPAPFWENALILPPGSENALQRLAIYEEGKIYLQSLSSMLPPLILSPKAGQDILDMAAAPGGKTTELCALCSNKASVTACEVNKVRAERLKFNLSRQGANRVNVMVCDARKLEDFFKFDKILLDAPCSGSGTMLLNDEASLRAFSPALVKNSAVLQLALLKKALKMLKKGGEMVYSTCSILEAENEDVLRGALKGSGCEICPVELPFMDLLPLLPSSLPGVITVCPTPEYEGFFAAKIRKIH